MNLQIIKHKTGYIGVSENKLKEIDYALFGDIVIEVGRISIPNNTVSFFNPLDGKLQTLPGINRFNKIICTTPDIQLEGIPLMQFEEDVEKLALEIIPEKIIYGENAGERDYDIYNPERISWIAGYNYRKETHPYSLEDMRKAIQSAYDFGLMKSNYGEQMINDIIEEVSSIPKFITIESKDGVPVLENGYVKITSKQ